MSLITFSGLASGIDSSALIDAILQKERAARITPFEQEVTKREETNSAFDELKTLLGELDTAAQPFRSLSGGAIAKGSSSSNETVLTATASNAAEAGTYNVTVNQLATNATFSFDDRFTAGTDTINSSINDGAIASDRTVSYTIGQGAGAESVNVELTSSSTANDFVTSFNSQSTLATASLVNTGTDTSPSYTVVIQSKNEGAEKGTITLTSIGTEITTAGTGAFTTNTLDQASDLNLSLDGIAGNITRGSNTVTDLIPGVSFTAASLGSSTIGVTVDATATESLLSDFVDKFNAVVDYVRENDAVTQDDSSGTTNNIFGALASTSLDDGLITALRSALTGSSTSGGTVNTLADLGIATQRDGTLAFNTDDFQTAISNDADSIELILGTLGESLGAVDGTIAQYNRFNGLIDEATSGNDTRISELQNKILTVEDSLAKKEDSLVSRFARLEAQISQLQSQQSVLTSLLPSG